MQIVDTGEIFGPVRTCRAWRREDVWRIGQVVEAKVGEFPIKGVSKVARAILTMRKKKKNEDM